MTTAEAKMAGGVGRVRATDPIGVRLYGWAVSVLFVGLVLPAYLRNPEPAGTAFVWFVVVAAAADVLRIRLGPELSFAVSLPVVLAAGMVLPPWQAALVGFLGTADVRELRLQVPLGRAVFNRSLVGLCALAASSVFHWLGGDPEVWPNVLIPSTVALAVDALLNAALVAYPVARMHRTSIRQVLRRLLEPDPKLSAVRYLCTGLMAPLLAAAWLFAGPFGLTASLMPLAVAWLAFREAEQLAFAESAVEVKTRALAAAVEETATERSDERLTLAGELHDEVLPALFKVHLMGEVIRNDLGTGRLLELEQDVGSLIEATSVAQLAIRQVVGSLRRSPLGPRGLAGSVKSLAERLESSGAPPVVLDAQPVTGSEKSQVVAYQVIREALSNAAKYAKAQLISVSIRQDQGLLVVRVADDGCGFDSAGPHMEPGHFGLELMKERVEAVGGSFALDSRLGTGTVVFVSIPPDA